MRGDAHLYVGMAIVGVLAFVLGIVATKLWRDWKASRDEKRVDIEALVRDEIQDAIQRRLDEQALNGMTITSMSPRDALTIVNTGNEMTQEQRDALAKKLDILLP